MVARALISASKLLLLAVSLLVFTGICFASDEAPIGSSKSKEMTGLRLGAIEFHPYLTLRETYSDNIYLTQTDRKHDTITTIMPGLQLQLPYRRHTLTFGSNATINRYTKYDSENVEDWTAYGAGDLNFGSHINLKLSDTYINGHEPRSQTANASIEKYRNNTASGSLTYIMADVSKLQLDYANTDWKFKNSDFRSRNENQASFYLYYRALAKTSVFAEYEFKNVNFVSNAAGLDNNVHSGLLGLTWELSSRSKGTIKGGYLYKKFDEKVNGDFGTFAASADVSHYFSDYDFFKLTGARGVNESSQLGTRYSVSTGINGEYTHRFLERLSVNLKGSYSNESFSDIAPGDLQLRKDNVMQTGASIQYAFRRWLDCTLEYYWRNKDSNLNYYDSTENNISLALKAFF